MLGECGKLVVEGDRISVGTVDGDGVDIRLIQEGFDCDLCSGLGLAVVPVRDHQRQVVFIVDLDEPLTVVGFRVTRFGEDLMDVIEVLHIVVLSGQWPVELFFA